MRKSLLGLAVAAVTGAILWRRYQEHEDLRSQWSEATDSLDG
ncbi:MAG: DLW-39 family protein [Promicromonosporaceae bacterium]|nr:DLW-39 family protein [Promicromonosporaceae bacterium]